MDRSWSRSACFSMPSTGKCSSWIRTPAQHIIVHSRNEERGEKKRRNPHLQAMQRSSIRFDGYCQSSFYLLFGSTGMNPNRGADHRWWSGARLFLLNSKHFSAWNHNMLWWIFALIRKLSGSYRPVSALVTGTVFALAADVAPLHRFVPEEWYSVLKVHFWFLRS